MSSTVQITDSQSSVQIFKSVTSNIISSLSGGMFSYGIGLMLLHDTHSPLSFGLNMLISPIISILFFIPIGNYVDRHNHRNIMIFSYIVRLITLLVFSFTINWFHGISEMIPVAAFVTIDAFLNNFRSTAYSASVHELVNNKKIAQLSSFTSACSAGSQILSPVLGIVLYSTIGLDGFIKIEAISTAISFIIMLTMKFFVDMEEDKERQSKTNKTQWNDFKDGIHYMNTRTLIKDIIILGAMVNFLFTAVNIGIPFIVVNMLHYSNGTIAFFDIGFSVGVLIGSIMANFIQEKGSFAVKLFLPLLVTGIGLLLLGMIFNTVTSESVMKALGLLTMMIIAFFVAILNVSLGVRMQRTVPTKLLGRVDSTLMTANQAATPLGTVVFTFLYQIIPNGSLILILTGIILIIYILVCIPFLYRNVKQDDQYLLQVDNGDKKEVVE